MLLILYCYEQMLNQIQNMINNYKMRMQLQIPNSYLSFKQFFIKFE